MTHISYSDLALIRQEAKKISRRDGISQSQAKEIFVKKHFGLQSYNQAFNSWKRQAEKEIAYRGKMATCNKCGFTFVADLNQDRKEHERFHIKFERTEKQFGTSPLVYDQQEKLKEMGYQLLLSDDLNEQVTGALKVIRGHYDRSLTTAIKHN